MNNNEIVIGGWYNPSLDDESIKKIKECGIDRLFIEGDNIGNNCLDGAKIDKYLGLCDEYDLSAYVQKGNEVDVSTAIAQDKRFSVHKSYLGLLMYDEPSAEMFDTLRKDVTRYHEARANAEPFVNLLPSYARSDSILGNYKGYVADYCDKLLKGNFNIKYLSFDFYPLIYGQNENLCLADRWLHDVYIVAKNADKYGVGANAFIQAMPFSKNEKKYGSRDRIPTYEDISLQFYVYLAFGFKGLTYFCLGTPYENEEFSKEGYALIDRNNKETPTYFYAMRINREVKSFSEVLAGYKWRDIEYIGKDELFDFAGDLKAYSNTGYLKIETEGKLLVGEFLKSPREKAVMLVNFGETTQTSPSMQTLSFGGETAVCVYRGGERMSIKANKLSLTLNAGEGVFITYEVL